MRHIVDLDEYRSPGIGVFSGRQRGTLVREAADLDRADREGLAVEISVPRDVFSLASGFMLNLLAPSIEALGPDEFRRRYRIVGDEVHQEWIDEAIRIVGNTSPPP